MGSENGNGRIVSLSDRLPKTDTQGRVLRHNATIADVHGIVQEECAKVHEHYLNQIPKFTAQMIQDALVGYGLLQVVPQPEVGARDSDEPAVPEIPAPDTLPPDTIAPAGVPCE